MEIELHFPETHVSSSKLLFGNIHFAILQPDPYNHDEYVYCRYILYIHIIYSYYIFLYYMRIYIFIINYVTVEFPLTTGSDTSWHTRTRWPSLTIQNSHSAALRTQLPSTQQIGTPWKINMEPTNHPFRKENDLPNHHFQVPCSSSRVYPHITRGPK